MKITHEIGTVYKQQKKNKNVMTLNRAIKKLEKYGF
jgi:hypothetical protein